MGVKMDYKRWYKLKIWLDLRGVQLDKNPLCERCVNNGKYVEATVVNHKIPHKGEWKLFNDPENLESVCKHCHDAVIQFEEIHGYDKAISENGWPIDNNHPFNKNRG